MRRAVTDLKLPQWLLVIPVVVQWAATGVAGEGEDSMEVVWHIHPGIQLHVGKMAGDGLPVETGSGVRNRFRRWQRFLGCLAHSRA